MRIVEIFCSIQGEGKFLGTPSLFIRLHGCNLYCKYCDTKYSWYRYVEKNLDEIYKEVKELLKKYKPQHLVITGGEPLLQQEEVISLINLIGEYFELIEIETNGTIMPKISNDKVFYNVSIKLSNSGVRYEDRIKEEVINYFNSIKNSIFKFVVKDLIDINEVRDLINRFKIKKEKVYLMPLANNRDELEKISRNIAIQCILHGFKYSDRLHLRLGIK